MRRETTPPFGVRTAASEPLLLRRLAEQRAKEQDACAESRDVRSQAVPAAKLDPALEMRLARQRQRLLAGESGIPEPRGTLLGSGCGRPPPGMEPKLEQRLAQQRRKADAGESNVGTVGPAAVRPSGAGPELAERLRRRLEREEALKQVDAPAAAAADASVPEDVPQLARSLSWRMALKTLGTGLTRACTRERKP